MTRKEAIGSLREICSDLGCSGLSASLCKDTPQDCKIIQRVMRGGNKGGVVENKDVYGPTVCHISYGFLKILLDDYVLGYVNVQEKSKSQNAGAKLCVIEEDIRTIKKTLEESDEAWEKENKDEGTT